MQQCTRTTKKTYSFLHTQQETRPKRHAVIKTYRQTRLACIMAYFLLMITLSFRNLIGIEILPWQYNYNCTKRWVITISVVSLNTFVNNFGRLAPFSTVAWLLIEIKQWSLDPFRKMFKRQKTLFRGTTNLQKFYSRCIIGCYVIIRKKVKMTKNVA